MAETKNAELIGILDELFSSLREEARPSKLSDDSDDPDAGPQIGFVDRLKLMEVGSRWVQIRNRIDPQDESDAFSEARNKLVGRARGGGAAQKGVRTNGAG
jgi:hypothetical protein